jgi:hypothetical protein
MVPMPWLVRGVARLNHTGILSIQRGLTSATTVIDSQFWQLHPHKSTLHAVPPASPEFSLSAAEEVSLVSQAHT